MPRTMPWFRFYNRMTRDEKILSLTDAEFRLLVHLWCRASESKVRGVIQMADGVGYPPDALVKGSGAGIEDPDLALAHIESLKLIERDSAGVVMIVNWDDLQYDHPSDRPQAQRERREERAEIKKPRRERPQPGEEAMSMAAFMSDRMRQVNTTINPRAQQIIRWARAIDLLHRIDGASWDDIRACIEWAYRSSFWQTVILSGDNLRKNFDRLNTQRLQRKGVANSTWREDDETGDLRTLVRR